MEKFDKIENLPNRPEHSDVPKFSHEFEELAQQIRQVQKLSNGTIKLPIDRDGKAYDFVIQKDGSDYLVSLSGSRVSQRIQANNKEVCIQQLGEYIDRIIGADVSPRAYSKLEKVYTLIIDDASKPRKNIDQFSLGKSLESVDEIIDSSLSMLQRIEKKINHELDIVIDLANKDLDHGGIFDHYNNSGKSSLRQKKVDGLVGGINQERSELIADISEIKADLSKLNKVIDEIKINTTRLIKDTSYGTQVLSGLFLTLMSLTEKTKKVQGESTSAQERGDYIEKEIRTAVDDSVPDIPLFGGLIENRVVSQEEIDRAKEVVIRAVDNISEVVDDETTALSSDATKTIEGIKNSLEKTINQFLSTNGTTTKDMPGFMETIKKSIPPGFMDTISSWSN